MCLEVESSRWRMLKLMKEIACRKGIRMSRDAEQPLSAAPAKGDGLPEAEAADKTKSERYACCYDVLLAFRKLPLRKRNAEAAKHRVCRIACREGGKVVQLHKFKKAVQACW
ncbi:hypothetical protein MRB53_038842 [Persea americana]|nr:hypothetical protein MRB53_038842 [Persea americana]